MKGDWSRRSFTFPSPTWPRGQEGESSGSRGTPPTPRGRPITVGSSARARALPPGCRIGRVRRALWHLLRRLPLLPAAGGRGRSRAGRRRAPAPWCLLGPGLGAVRRGAGWAAGRAREGSGGRRAPRLEKVTSALRCHPGRSTRPPSRSAAHDPASAEMSAAGVRGLRATYHRVLDKVELMLPEKLRPIYNHPAGSRSGMALSDTRPPPPSKIDLERPRAALPLKASPAAAASSLPGNRLSPPPSQPSAFPAPVCPKPAILPSAPCPTFVAPHL